MHISRYFTTPAKSPYDSIQFRTTSSEIRNPDGSVVFRQDDIEVPSEWSQVACDVLAQKYFRKAGVAARLKPVKESGVPQWLWRHTADTKALKALPEDQRYGGENSAKQVIDRLAGTWTYWGWKGRLLRWRRRTPARSMMSFATCSPSRCAPRIRRSGSTPACTGPTASTVPPRATTSPTPRPEKWSNPKPPYEHPQPHACFIQGISDDLVNEGGIMDLWVREARLFKYGSGTGTNFSRLRGAEEPLSGGGRSSGLMSFLKIGDRAAGAIKSGGTTRRAAKMVVVDIDHPDIEAFINWKVARGAEGRGPGHGLAHRQQALELRHGGVR